MTGGRPYHAGFDFIGKDELGVVRAVENEMPFYFGMLLRKSFKNFVGEPADALEFMGQKEAGIYGNFHPSKIASINIYL